ncbi:glycosyltransferase [Celeribacter sp.]|uniref:glycosyltransferase n=1 Tax=Celeribacter sp. TaxID=1890673 RepID=UPI003A8DB79B
MRILRVIAGVDASQGGPVEGLKSSALLHRDAGIETEVVCLDAPDSAAVRTFPVKAHGVGPTPRRYGYTRALGQWIDANAHRFDAAVVHGLWNHASVGGGRALMRNGLPYLLFVHGMMDPWFKARYPTKHITKQLFWWALQGRVLAGAERVLFTTQEEMRLANGVFHGHSYKGEVIAYGAGAPDADARTTGPAAFRAAVPDLGAAPYLLFLSRIHEKKGVDILLDAFAAIAAKRPELHLVIAGPDEAGLVRGFKLRAETRGLVGRIHFPGMITGPAKWGAFLGADAFVLASHQENFGIAVAEALACGCPVLTTDKVNIWREIEAAGAGLIAKVTLPDFTRILDKWCALSDAERSAMAARALACYEAHFDPKTAATALSEKLESIRRG